MAEIKLPLKIRVDVRDNFDSPNCPVQKAFGTVGSIIGLKTQCDVEWDMLYHSLESAFPEKATFVPSIADAVVGWCDVLSTRLEDDNYAAWTDELTDKVGEIGLIKIHLQVSQGSRPNTTWSDSHRGFVISFPQKTAFQSRNVSSGFESDFQNYFVSNSDSSKVESLPIRNREDDWAEITESSEIASVAMTPAYSIPPSRPERMPNVATMSNLDTFLKSTVPYILIVSQGGSSKYVESGTTRVFNQGAGRTMGHGSSTLTEQGAGNLVIQGTHSPSLQFVEQYLKRWVRKDHQDTRKIPLLNIQLHESNFGIGIHYDTLTVEPYDTPQEKRGVVMNPSIVLLLIESVLGYHCVSRFNPGSWEYRRDTPFA